MDGFDYQQLKRVEEKAEYIGLHFEVHGNSFILREKNRTSLGYFPNINEVYVYMTGYEAGRSKGRCEQPPIEQ